MCAETKIKSNQEAITHWFKIKDAKDQFESAHKEATTWFRHNRMYLDNPIQYEFIAMLAAARVHHELTRLPGTNPRSVDEFMDKFLSFPRVLFATVGLPPMSMNDQ